MSPLPLCDPAQTIANYNKSFGKDPDAISVAELRRQWQARFAGVAGVVSLASKAYNGRLAAAVPEGVRVDTPLAGMNLFQRTAWLKRALCEADVKPRTQ